MTTTNLESLWKPDAPDSVRVGDVVDAAGKALDVQRLIMRRWGWPKKAAKRAAEYIEERAQFDETHMMLPVSGDACRDFQRKLFERLDGLLDDLLEGVANRAMREAKDAHRRVGHVEIVFVRDTPAGRVVAGVTDEGMLTSLISVVAGRLGVTVDELRGRCDFARIGPDHVTITVWTDED